MLRDTPRRPSDSDRTLRSIAAELGVSDQTILVTERRAMTKLIAGLEARGWSRADIRATLAARLLVGDAPDPVVDVSAGRRRTRRPRR